MFRSVTIVALISLVLSLVFAAPDALARGYGRHAHSAGAHIGARGGFAYYPYAYVPRPLAYTDYNDPVCASVRRRIQLDAGLRWHRTRRCGY